MTKKPREERAIDLMDATDPMDEPGAPRRCTATSKQTGARCRRAPIPGGTVCNMHGAGAPQVQKAARANLLEMIEPALRVLQKALKQRDLNLALKAAKDVLNRTGHVAPIELKGSIQIDVNRAHERETLRFATDAELAELDAIWERIEERAYAAGIPRPPGRALAIPNSQPALTEVDGGRV